MIPYEEQKAIKSPWHWVILLLLCLLLIGWALWNYFLISDAPRQWDFGTLPDTPAQSIYSTDRPGLPAHPPRQITPLPEAHPKQRVDP